MQTIFVRTANVQMFTDMMASLSRHREGVIGLVHGRAGHGKSETARWYAAQSDGGAYVYAKSCWTPRWALHDVLAALGGRERPGRIQACFDLIGSKLNERLVTLYIDEADKVKPDLMETFRELSDITGRPIVLIGEDRLAHLISREPRLRSRTAGWVEFKPLSDMDVFGYCKQTLDFPLSADATHKINDAARGDFRPVIRILEMLEKIVDAGGSGPTPLAIEEAIKRSRQKEL